MADITIKVIYSPGDFEKNLITVHAHMDLNIEETIRLGELSIIQRFGFIDDSGLCLECNESEATLKNLCPSCYNKYCNE